MVYQDGLKEWIPLNSDEGGRRMENRLPHSLWANERTIDIPRHDESYLFRLARPRGTGLHRRHPDLCRDPGKTRSDCIRSPTETAK